MWSFKSEPKSIRMLAMSSAGASGRIGPVWRAALVIWGLLCLVTPGAAVELDFGIQKVLEGLSLPLPDPSRPIVCHGFGCAYQTPIQLRPVDRAQLKKLFNATAAKSP